MQFKLAAVSAIAFATLATATPTGTGGGSTPPPAGQCNTGEAQCCNSVQAANTPSAAALLGLLGIVLQDVTALVGITCSPLSVIGVGGSGWYVFFVDL